jgi:hypothetical protein
MLTRPITNTVATEATATGTNTMLKNTVMVHTYHRNRGCAIVGNEIQFRATIWSFMY